ncbi:MAG TPA: UDP-N-acetylmuramoyl-L-alanyl-D-glutamate--2,6-diaminopimelate ligase [Acidimicrobiales bacterium]|nr:UDP-N-acetylmuramoyl-L-alanyl-D-glutamate--2,6-diaminopimelate ligase [Acidimicrobiales bacterium]
MRLDTLVAAAREQLGEEVARIVGPGTVEIGAVTHDSREVVPGTLFACVPGRRTDGHDLAGAAVSSGAVALVVEHRVAVDVPQVVVGSVRAALGPLADAFWNHPSRRLVVVGVTGTNGKTTTVSLLAAILERHGWPTATIGTLTQARTTPEAPQLQARLASLADRGVSAVAMEVSSHALDQHRVDAVRFAAGVLTNVTQDHLDYHQTMDAYFEAKARLLEPGRAGVAVINGDDPWGRRLIDRLAAAGHPAVTWQMSDATGIELRASGSRFVWQGRPIDLRLPGAFNVANALAAATCARALGVSASAIAGGLSSVVQVPGRFETVDAGQPFTVLVDYAHTPDGLGQALSAARQLTRGRLIVVFGAGGDRDQAKRPQMGEVAARVADLVVLTSDNPRGEDPQAIIDAVFAGAAGPGHVLEVPDRSDAIRTALGVAGDDDIVVIAGKGHEKGQEIAGRILPFDDADEARRHLERIVRSRLGRDDQ